MWTSLFCSQIKYPNHFFSYGISRSPSCTGCKLQRNFEASTGKFLVFSHSFYLQLLLDRFINPFYKRNWPGKEQLQSILALHEVVHNFPCLQCPVTCRFRSLCIDKEYLQQRGRVLLNILVGKEIYRKKHICADKSECLCWTVKCRCSSFFPMRMPAPWQTVMKW